MSNIPVLDETERLLEARLKELEPLHREYLTLESVRREMEKARTGRVSTIIRQRKRGETTKAIREFVKKNPEGVTVQDIANAIKVRPNYVYAVTRHLTQKGEFVRRGRKIAPADAEQGEQRAA